MTETEILEGNKLIRVFMVGFVEGDSFWIGDDANEYSDEIKYHKSWNWIMPVIEKIETMDYGFKMCRKVVEVYVDSTKSVIVKTKEASRMESLFKAVVEFINLYNSDK